MCVCVCARLFVLFVPLSLSLSLSLSVRAMIMSTPWEEVEPLDSRNQSVYYRAKTIWQHMATSWQRLETRSSGSIVRSTEALKQLHPRRRRVLRGHLGGGVIGG